MNKQVFINNFQKGTQQSSNLGIGVCVGFDLYSKPGAAILGKKITSLFQFSLNEYPTYTDISNNSNATPNIAISGRLWVQTNKGSIYYSDDYGVTFNNPTFTGTPPVSASGNGLVVYENFVFIFFNSEIWYTDKNHKADSAAPNFIQWKTGIDNGTVQPATSPISENHFPFIFPNNRGIFFANNNAIGSFGSVVPPGATVPTPFDPSGTINTDYTYVPLKFTFSNNYIVNTIDSLPPGSLAIGANNLSSGQESDIFTWDTKSPNVASFPIKIFSGVNINGSQGVKQLVNRLNVIYLTVGGNNAIYSTNGGTANIIADFSQYASIRNGNINSNGNEYPLPVYYNSFPSATAVSGNKILTGTATSVNNSYYPGSLVGVFPTGIWSTYFNNDGSTLQQMDYSIPFLPGVTIGSLSAFATPGDYSGVTSIKPLANGKLAIGYISVFGGSGLGNIIIFDNIKYITDIANTSLESELFEIGTALVPATPEKIEINLIKNLLSDQTIEISYRTATDQNWTIIQTFNGATDGSKNYYSIQQHPISAVQYLQLRVRGNTGTTNPNDTIELRSIAIS